MKKTLVAALFVLLTLGLNTSCSKDDAPPSAPSSPSAPPAATSTATPVCTPLGMQDFIGIASGGLNMFWASRIDLAADTRIEAVEAWTQNVSRGGQIRMGIYAHDSGNNKPSTLIVGTDAVTPSADSWNRVYITPLVLPAGSYWAAVLSQYVTISCPPVATGAWAPGSYWTSGTAWGPLPAAFPSGWSETYGHSVGLVDCPDPPTATPTPTLSPTPTPTFTCQPGAFGESVGGGASNLGSASTWASPFTLVSDAAVTAIRMGTFADGVIRLGIYSDSASAPSALRASSALVPTTAGWTTVGVGPVTLSPGTYWLAMKYDASGTNTTFTSNLGSGLAKSASGDFPDPWVNASTSSSFHLTIEALYDCP